MTEYELIESIQQSDYYLPNVPGEIIDEVNDILFGNSN